MWCNLKWRNVYLKVQQWRPIVQQLHVHVIPRLIYTIPDSFRAAVKTTVDRPTIYSIPDNFCKVVKTIVDGSSVYN